MTERRAVQARASASKTSSAARARRGRGDQRCDVAEPRSPQGLDALGATFGRALVVSHGYAARHQRETELGARFEQLSLQPGRLQLVDFSDLPQDVVELLRERLAAHSTRHCARLLVTRRTEDGAHGSRKDRAPPGSEQATGLMVAQARAGRGQPDGNVDRRGRQPARLECGHDLVEAGDDPDVGPARAAEEISTRRNRCQHPPGPAAVDAADAKPHDAAPVAQSSAAQFTWSFGVSVTRRPTSSSSSAAARAAGPPSKRA